MGSTLQLGEKDLGSIAAALLVAQGSILEPPDLGERHRFGGGCASGGLDARFRQRDRIGRLRRRIETESAAARFIEPRRRGNVRMKDELATILDAMRDAPGGARCLSQFCRS